MVCVPEADRVGHLHPDRIRQAATQHRPAGSLKPKPGTNEISYNHVSDSTQGHRFLKTTSTELQAKQKSRRTLIHLVPNHALASSSNDTPSLSHI